MSDFEFDSRHYIDEVFSDWEQIDQNNKEAGNSNYFSLFYKLKIDDKKEITAQTSYYDYVGENFNNFLHHILDITMVMKQIIILGKTSSIITEPVPTYK